MWKQVECLRSFLPLLLFLLPCSPICIIPHVSYKQNKMLLLLLLKKNTDTQTYTKWARNMNCILHTHVRLLKPAITCLRSAQATPSIKRVQNYNWPSRMPNNNWLRQTFSHEETDTFLLPTTTTNTKHLSSAPTRQRLSKV